LVLTDSGTALVERLKPLWQAFDQAALTLNAEAGEVAAALDRLDDALAQRSLFDRIMDKLAASPTT